MSTSTTGYRDGLSIGQLAREWERDADFVRGLIKDGKLSTDERGCVTISSLRDFYLKNPHPFDG